jgi:chromosomal replication initiator protein
MSANDCEKLWKTILGELEISTTPATFKTFFLPSFVLNIENNIVTISCPSPLARDRLDGRFYSQIQKICQNFLGHPVELSFVLGQRQGKIQDIGPLFSTVKTEEQVAKSSNLYPDYTFDKFIVGSNNKLAHAVATSVVASPGKAYNPFFLYSNVGLGKTHLAQAVGNAILIKYPEKKVIYTTGESFTNQLIEAIRRGSREQTTAEFRKKYRNVDVLIVDDIQFIAGREATQEEFFHTFNALYLDKKQIIATSDRPPHEIDKLAPRISSRLASGIIVDMQFPDSETRKAILRQKRDLLGENIPDNILDFIADAVNSNIRELEGAFMQVVLKQKVSEEPLTIASVKDALKIAKEEKKSKMLSVSEIINAVATYYDLRQKDILGESRLKNIVTARHVAMFIIRFETGISLSAVGGLLGGRDHSTIIHATEKIKRLLAKDLKLKKEMGEIKENLGI